jgi:DNA polymerase I-like protein with 3'-5' exonuclease and polymerase domains
VLRYDAAKKHGRLLLTVHDQLLACVPKRAAKQEMRILREAMEGVELGAPLLSDGAMGYRWTELEDCE